MLQNKAWANNNICDQNEGGIAICLNMGKKIASGIECFCMYIAINKLGSWTILASFKQYTSILRTHFWFSTAFVCTTKG